MKKNRCNKSLLTSSWAGVLLLASCTMAAAHEPTVAPQETEPSASSLLESTSPNGRIGGYQYNGSIRPTPGVGSRFSNNARYGSAGNVVGIDRNSSSSRFQGGAEDGRFHSKMDFNVIALKNELQRAREAETAGNRMNARQDSGTPRLVTATTPERIPYATNRRPGYGKTQAELLALQRQALSNPQTDLQQALVPDAEQTPAPNEMFGLPQQLWMRGRAPVGSMSLADPWNARLDNSVGELTEAPFASGPSAFDSYEASLLSPAPALSDGSALGGALQLAPHSANVVSFPPQVPTAEETRLAFQEYLEAQLLRSPDVNPLSPVQVNFQNGVATVRGVVPTSTSRVVAGRILLADPRVTKVNNLLTCARNDAPEVPVQNPSSVPEAENNGVK